MGTDQDYSKSGPAENTITLDLNIFTQNMKATHGNDIPPGHIKITQNLESQKMQLQLASRFVPGTWGVTYENDILRGKSRLLKIWVCKKKKYTGAQYFSPNHGDCIWTRYSIGAIQHYPTSGENAITQNVNICTHRITVTYENIIP